ncbi:iron(III) transport system ATP-binding protein [Arthrobacter pascens]|uniref:ABC transporter ATP-binding protein n=1 Tax=Arthrobacter pascens TaxID=1677 RepID=UPI00279079DF|nr:ABC transporter ATP-binding protein [Arthrobacter pascens]MDQ0676949.1 iron(III) transport system ATP-binding protein [Arthrobacter pascens]
MTRVFLNGISKQYPGAKPAVSNLTVTIDDGEFFTLLGPSGCGKSTTLRMVAGFIQPSSGSIHFGDKDVTNAAPNKRDTGMVFQNYALFPHMSVRGNVAYGLNARNVPKQDKKRRIDEALAQVGLEEFGDRRIDMLSGGQQQRVALARALVIRPAALLLDEPLSNLDAKLREETRTEIRSTQKAAGTTCLYVTHDQAEAMAMSDRVAVLNAGELHQVGSPREVYNRPATSFVARFIGRSNVLACTVLGVDAGSVSIRLADGTVLKTPRIEGAISARVSAGDQAAVSLRPESIILTVNPGQDTAGQLSGRVLTAEFTGAVNVYEIDWHGERIVVSAPDSVDRAEPGDLVSMAPHQDRVWLVEP